MSNKSGYKIKLYGFHLGEFESHLCVNLNQVNRVFYNFTKKFGLHHFELERL